MTNPWGNLPYHPPYILPDEQEKIKLFNDKVSKEDGIIEKQLPGPYLGNPKKARVVILSLNPGYNNDDTKLHEEEPDFYKPLRKNLSHEDIPYPFYYLNPIWKDRNCGGYKYWYPLLNDIIEEIAKNKSKDDAIRLVARRVSVIEWFPYHSKTFYKNIRFYKKILSELKSQQYSIDLAKEALKDKQKLIVVQRAYSLWEHKLGSLSETNVITHKSGRPPINWYLKRKNLLDNDFDRICNKIMAS